MMLSVGDICHISDVERALLVMSELVLHKGIVDGDDKDGTVGVLELRRLDEVGDVRVRAGRAWWRCR